MTFRRTAVIAACAALAAGAAGCGGDDESSDSTATDAVVTDSTATESSTTSADAPTKDEYIAQADQICGDANDTIAAAATDAGLDENSTDDETTAFITDEVIPTSQDELDSLRALTPPEGDEDETAAIYDAFEEGLGTVEDDPSIVLNGTDPLQDASKLATEYGLQTCGG